MSSIILYVIEDSPGRASIIGRRVIHHEREQEVICVADTHVILRDAYTGEKCKALWAHVLTEEEKSKFRVSE